MQLTDWATNCKKPFPTDWFNQFGLEGMYPTSHSMDFISMSSSLNCGIDVVSYHSQGISGILCPMKFTHHGLQIEIPDEWWTETGMRGFVPTFTAYRVSQRSFPNVREVLI